MVTRTAGSGRQPSLFFLLLSFYIFGGVLYIVVYYMERVSLSLWLLAEEKKKMRNAYKKSSGEGSAMAEVELDWMWRRGVPARRRDAIEPDN
jgi:hypothetical protein